jgi:hypothetical protein
MAEWTLPHDPEILYLRERVARLEAELEGYRRPYSITSPPKEIAVPTLNPSLSLLALAEVKKDPLGLHIIARAGGKDGFAYGYYASNRELYQARDLTGILAHLHHRLIRKIAMMLAKESP